MSKSVVSFTKQTGHVTPFWILQQEAAIDAVLIFKLADEIASIWYDVPTERMPRTNYLSGIVNGASDEFRLGYQRNLESLGPAAEWMPGKQC